MSTIKFLISLFLLSSLSLSAQDFEDLPGVDAVYFEDIKSIEYRVGTESTSIHDQWDDIGETAIHIDSLQRLLEVADNVQRNLLDEQLQVLRNKQNNAYRNVNDRDSWSAVLATPFTPIPIYNLHSDQQIQFAFDDLHSETTNYSYTVIPYLWDWSAPSSLTVGDYLDGFSTSRIDNFFFAEITTANYSSYRFSFPNAEIKPLISGNFLLVVYETNSEEVAFTRRIHISEQSFFFEHDVRDVSFDRDSLQYINFTISYPKELNHIAPARDVKVMVLQNGRYDNAIIKEKPALAMNNKLRYGYQDPIGFQPGKEFRYIQMQTFDFAQIGVNAVRKGKESNEVFLATQEERIYHPNFFYRDLNGKFVNMNGVNNEELGNADYAHVYFSFDKHDPYYQADLYIVGKLTDWQFKDEFRLSYNERDKRYEGEAFLKQGYYDYYYALKHENSDRIDIDITEGHAFQTNNEYTILIYHTTLNGRYDKLVAIKTLVVNNN